jgi:hypothetical protein
LQRVREVYVKKDRDQEFDASVGLAFSLKAFETYQTSGTLSAEVRAIPGIRGQCLAYLELLEGKVVSCYLLDRAGDRHPFMKETLIKLDETKGPFTWTFREATTSIFTTPFLEQTEELSAPLVPSFPVPIRLIRHLDVRRLQQWTPEQRQWLLMVFSMVNGQSGIDDIKEHLPLHPHIVDEAIRILILLQVITMQEPSL